MPEVSGPTTQSKLWAETVLSLNVMKQPPVIAAHWVWSAWKRLVLIWIKRESYVTGKLGVGTALDPAGADCTVTLKSTPANAELVAVVPCFELTVTSVRSPITADGLTTNTLPVPLLVLI
jgi:hypothetical protein